MGPMRRWSALLCSLNQAKDGALRACDEAIVGLGMIVSLAAARLGPK